jgi:hypothetical protein
MDVKYAYYNTSKGYKVTGGTAAHFLKADGSLDNASYVIQSTLNAQLDSYALLNGVQTFTNINTFTQSPLIPAGTLDAHAVNLQQLKKFAPISKKRTYFLESPVYNVGMVNRVYLPNDMVGDVTLRVNSSYHNAYAIGIIEIQFTFGVNGGGAWGFECRCTQAFGAVVERIYVEQKIYFDSNTGRIYINVHKFHTASNPIFIDVEITSHGGTVLKDDSVFLQEDSAAAVLDLRNKTNVDDSLDLKADKNGNNATDTWINSSNGLQNNPTIVGKMANSGGQSSLANATYGQVAGYINTNGIAQGCPTDDWWYKFKMLHNNSAGYYGEIAVQMTGGSSLRYKRVEAGADYGWVKVWDEQNYNPFKNLIFTGDLDTVADSGIYRQEGPTSGFSYTTTLNLNSSDGRQQLTIERGGKGMKFRGSNAGSGNSGWSGWNEVYHTGNFNPASYVTQSTFNTQLGNYATMAWVGQNYVDAPDGYSVIISGQDLNDVKNTGFYRGSGLGYAPNNGWFFVIVEAHDSTWVKQTVTTYGSGNTANMTYQRVMSGGAWSAWQKVWTTQDFSQANINAWNNLTNGIIVNQEFTYNTGVGLMLVDDYYGGDSGMIDNHYERFVSGKQNDYYKYGSIYGTFDGLNFNFNTKLFGMGREANKNDKLTVEGSVKASQNFKSEDEKPNTIFIPNGNLATLNDEIVNDESEYAIRLDPHEYEIDPSGYLNVDDRNRLIHIIGEQVKMVVDFKKVYYKQQIVIYNFDQSGNMMAVKIQGKIIYNIEPGCFLRLYVTKSLRIIAEKQQPCDFIW